MGASKEQRLATAERRAKMLQLRRAGTEWEEIAKALGYASKGAAQKDYGRIMAQAAREVRENADLNRAEEIARLNRLQRGLWPAAAAGEPKSASTVLRVIELRARFGGYGTPPELEDRIREEMTARIVPQMALVWGKVLDGLGLTDAQRAAVPGLMDDAIRSFQDQQQAGRRRELDAGDDIDDVEAA